MLCFLLAVNLTDCIHVGHEDGNCDQFYERHNVWCEE
jgi:hypothetical protein